MRWLKRLNLGNGKPIMRLRDWAVVALIILVIWLAATGRLSICDPTPSPDSVYPACEGDN